MTHVFVYEVVHLDWIIPLAHFMDAAEYKVTFYTSESFESDLRESLQDLYHRFTWIYDKPETGNRAFYQKFNHAISGSAYDIILLNSVDSKHLLLYTILAGKKRSKIVFNVHDVNNFFQAKFGINLRKNIRTIGKKLLHTLIDAFIVNADEMRQYISETNLTTKPVFWLPPVICTPRIQTRRQEPFTIVVPGSIDWKRRDYDALLLLLNSLSDALANRIKLIIAGRPVGDYGRMIISQCSQLQAKGFAIEYFDEEIPEVKFQSIISQSDVILSPLQRETAIHDNISEKYGMTKGSGNVYDAIRHAKPLILPDHVQVYGAISSSCIKYNGIEHLKEIIQLMLENQDYYNEYQSEAYKNALLFQEKEMKQRFKNIIVSVKAL